MTWQSRAACLGADLALFMPNTTDPFPIVTDTARRFCAVCPVMDRCGREADLRRDAGLRGGVYRNGSTSKYRRYPLLDGAVLEPMEPRLPGVRLDRKVAL